MTDIKMNGEIEEPDDPIESAFWDIHNSICDDLPLTEIKPLTKRLLITPTHDIENRNKCIIMALFSSLHSNRKDMVCYLLANHYAIIKDILTEAMLYGALCEHYEITKVLLEAGVLDMAVVNIDNMCSLAPHLEEHILSLYNEIFKRNSSFTSGNKISSRQVGLLKDDIKLIEILEEYVESINVSDKDLHSRKLLDACMFSAHSCLSYFLQSSKYTAYLSQGDNASKRTALGTLFSLTFKDIKALELLFKYNIFDKKQDKKLTEPNVLDQNLATMLHHVASSGMFLYLSACMVDETWHARALGTYHLHPSVPDIIEFLLNQGLSKYALCYSKKYTATVRPMTLLGLQPKTWLRFNDSESRDYSKDDFTKIIIQTMDKLKFHPSSLHSSEINPIHFTMSETVIMMDSVDSCIFINGLDCSALLQSLEESLQVSTEIITWLLKQGFKWPIAVYVQGTYVTGANICDVIVDFLTRLEFLMSYGLEEMYGNKGNILYDDFISEIRFQYKKYFINIMLLFYSERIKIYANNTMGEMMFHPMLKYFDVENDFTRICLNQCSQTEYKVMLQKLIQYGKDFSVQIEATNKQLELFDYLDRTPRKLMDLSRSCIVCSMKGPLLTGICDLPLPQSLKHYIQYLK